MEQQREKALVSYYMSQFGILHLKGRLYLKDSLFCYIENGYVYDSDKILLQVCQKKGVKRDVLYQGVRYFLRKSWEKGFSWHWKYFLGWDLESPPASNVAVRLLCENYVPFVEKYKKFIFEIPYHELRKAIEESEKKEISKIS